MWSALIKQTVACGTQLFHLGGLAFSKERFHRSLALHDVWLVDIEAEAGALAAELACYEGL